MCTLTLLTSVFLVNATLRYTPSTHSCDVSNALERLGEVDVCVLECWNSALGLAQVMVAGVCVFLNVMMEIMS